MIIGATFIKIIFASLHCNITIGTTRKSFIYVLAPEKGFFFLQVSHIQYTLQTYGLVKNCNKLKKNAIFFWSLNKTNYCCMIIFATKQMNQDSLNFVKESKIILLSSKWPVSWHQAC